MVDSSRGRPEAEPRAPPPVAYTWHYHAPAHNAPNSNAPATRQAEALRFGWVSMCNRFGMSWRGRKAQGCHRNFHAMSSAVPSPDVFHPWSSCRGRVVAQLPVPAGAKAEIRISV